MNERPPVLRILAVGVEDYPPRFTVAAPFADRLNIGDLVRFMAHPAQKSSLWSKTWRVVTVDKHTEDTRKVFVVEVQR